MDQIALILIILGSLFMLGLLTDLLGRRTSVPRVTLLLVFGMAIGPAGLGWLPDIGLQWFPLVTTVALVMVGFLLGGTLTVASLREHGRIVLWISLTVVLVTAATVLVGLTAVGLSLPVALLLAGIATATDPAATADVVHETRSQGRFSTTLLGIVAIDDLWGLLAFSVVLAVTEALVGNPTQSGLVHATWDLGGAVAIGCVIGVPSAYLTGRIEPGEPTQAEALGVVLLCGGVAVWLDVSFLLASMTLGCVVTNLAHHHRRPFHAIEGIEWPFLILFFMLAGASLDVSSLRDAGAGCIAYVVFRIVGRVAGGWLGARLGNASVEVRRWTGLALLPQAGVALGMALIASQRFPELADLLLAVAIGATVFFELIGPLFTRLALTRAKETGTSPRSK